MSGAYPLLGIYNFSTILQPCELFGVLSDDV
jgi:hypothetical protein